MCDSGASLSFIDKTLAERLNAHGEEVDLSLAGIHGTNDVKCEQFTVGIHGKTKSDTHHMISTYQELKIAYLHLSVLSEET